MEGLRVERVKANGKLVFSTAFEAWLVAQLTGLPFRWLRRPCVMRSMRTSFDAGCGSTTWRSPREHVLSCRRRRSHAD